MKILVVDDEKMARNVLSQTLQKAGYEVITASDGAQAWTILKNNTISMVVSDWIMPGIDGLELCRRIRSYDFPGYVFVILVTSKDSRNDFITGMDAGADDFIVKPFNKEELSARIKC